MSKILALDIETTGLDPWRDEILMVGLWDGEKYTCIRNPIELFAHLAWEEQQGDFEFVAHNAGFDIKFLLVQEWLTDKFVDSKTIHDTKILAHLAKNKVPQTYIEQYETRRKELNKTLPKGHSHREASPLSLKVLAPWFLKVPPFWETPGHHDDEEYNQKDCMYTYRLFHILSERVKQEGSWTFYEKRMLEWSKMIREMEIKGICINMVELDTVAAEYQKKQYDLKLKLDEMWDDAHLKYWNDQARELLHQYEEMKGRALIKAKDVAKCSARYDKLLADAISRLDRKINYSSPKQMAWLLKDYLGLDITTAEGEESTGKSVLHKLAADGREDIKTYLEWREADKVLTMYLPTYRELQVDGVIHPSFNLTGTRTGRTSSSGPNLQQVPPKLYRLFMPRSGYRFVQYDLSGIEAALIALYSGDKRLYEILDKGESIHDHNANALFTLDCPIHDVAKRFPRERKCAKTIGFACFYGAGWRRIKLAFASAGFPISDAQAKEMLAKLKAYYPEAFAYHKEITQVFEEGETVHNLVGRPINLQPHENPYMQGFNTLIQSSASDLNLMACEKFWKDSIQELGGGAYPLLVIHDCIMAEAKEQYACYADDFLQWAMTNFKLKSDNGHIKLKVEGGVSDHWAK